MSRDGTVGVGVIGRGFGQTVDFRTDPVTQFAVVGNTCVLGSSNAVWLSRKRGTNDIVLRGPEATPFEA